MENELKLIILTPESKVYEKSARSVVAPAHDGLLGVLPMHAPLLTTLTPGTLTIKDINGTKTVMKIKDGFLEVVDNVVTVLTDAIEIPNN